MPEHLSPLLSSTTGILGLRTGEGLIALPVQWDAGRGIATLPAGLGADDFIGDVPACVTFDEPVHVRPTEQRGVVLRGHAQFVDGRHRPRNEDQPDHLLGRLQHQHCQSPVLKPIPSPKEAKPHVRASEVAAAQPAHLRPLALRRRDPSTSCARRSSTSRSAGWPKLTEDYHDEGLVPRLPRLRQAKEKLFATFMTPARDADGDADKRWDTARVAAMSRAARLLRTVLLVPVAGHLPRPRPGLAERQRGRAGTRGGGARRRRRRRRSACRSASTAPTSTPATWC